MTPFQMLLSSALLFTSALAFAGNVDVGSAGGPQNTFSISEGFQLSDEALIPAKTLLVRSLSEDIPLRNVEIRYMALCQYNNGNFFGDPTGKSCGGGVYVLSPGTDGRVELPAFKKFKGFHAGNPDNYYIYLIVGPKEKKSEGPPEEWFTIYAAGEKSFAQFTNFSDPINLIAVKPLKIDVRIEGQTPSQFQNANPQTSNFTDISYSFQSSVGRAGEMTGHGAGGRGTSVRSNDFEKSEKYTVSGFITGFVGDLQSKSASLRVYLRSFKDGGGQKEYVSDSSVNPTSTHAQVNLKKN
jgi:hypothetical protein